MFTNYLSQTSSAACSKIIRKFHLLIQEIYIFCQKKTLLKMIHNTSVGYKCVQLFNEKLLPFEYKAERKMV